MEKIKWEDIPDSVFEGIEQVRQSAKYNMFDAQSVFNELFQLGYHEAVNWLLNPRQKEGNYRSQVDYEKYVAVLNNWDKLTGDQE